MRLIGMLDSPYVRRVAISLRLMGVPFTHKPVSVFRHFDAFAAINPVVKAPTLVTDDGVVLMDSTLILDHVERLVPPERWLMPQDVAGHAHAQRRVGLALAACEKAVQYYYELELRPEEKRHQPWIDRVRSQLHAALAQLDGELAADAGEGWSGGRDAGEKPFQPDVSAAVALSFIRLVLPQEIADDAYPALSRLTARAEATREFLAIPMLARRIRTN